MIEVEKPDIWWIPDFKDPYGAIKKENAELALALRQSKINISKCIDCSKVWESENLRNERENIKITRVYYHKDFPTYGLPRATCPKCKEKNETR